MTNPIDEAIRLLRKKHLNEVSRDLREHSALNLPEIANWQTQEKGPCSVCPVINAAEYESSKLYNRDEAREFAFWFSSRAPDIQYRFIRSWLEDHPNDRITINAGLDNK